jgi:hypothetical protein
MDGYSVEIESQIRRFFDSLSEADRRRYAGIEAVKLGHVGIKYLSDLLGCDPKTIERGISELETDEALPSDRQRKKGVDAELQKRLRQNSFRTSLLS